MNILIRNIGTTDQHCIAWHENPQGFGPRYPEPLLLLAGSYIELTGEDIATVDIGYNPTAVEELRNAIADATATIAALIQRILDGAAKPIAAGTEVSVTIENRGTAGVRIIPELNVAPFEVPPGSTANALGAYVEVRQLGM